MGDFKVTVHGKRAETFEQVFGTTTVEVESPVPEYAELPGFSHPQRVYRLKLGALTGEQYDRLVAYIMRTFGESNEAVVRRYLEKTGMPILTADAALMIENPQRWVD